MDKLINKLINFVMAADTIPEAIVVAGVLIFIGLVLNGLFS